MEKTYDLTFYQAPAVRVINLDFDTVFCISGTHVGFNEEDWDDLP